MQENLSYYTNGIDDKFVYNSCNKSITKKTQKCCIRWKYRGWPIDLIRFYLRLQKTENTHLFKIYGDGCKNINLLNKLNCLK